MAGRDTRVRGAGAGDRFVTCCRHKPRITLCHIPSIHNMHTKYYSGQPEIFHRNPAGIRTHYSPASLECFVLHYLVRMWPNLSNGTRMIFHIKLLSKRQTELTHRRTSVTLSCPFCIFLFIIC